MRKIVVLTIVLCVLWPFVNNAKAQSLLSNILSMEDVVRLAQDNSIMGMAYKNLYLSSYWSFRSYQAEYRPSLNLSSNVANFNRSLVELQDFNTGEKAYRSNYSMTNDVTLSVVQNIALTGGTLSLSTSLNKLDQYGSTRSSSYYSQPIYLSYSQLLWGYNRFKWNKKIEPKNMEFAKREYIENMEQVAIQAINYFWDYASQRESFSLSERNFEESKRLYQTAQTRFDMGTISRENLLQLELNVLNDSLLLINRRVSLRTSLNRLCSYIGYQENSNILLSINYNVPELILDFDGVMEKAFSNSSFEVKQAIQAIEADANIAQAKSNRGMSASINARFGMSGTAESFDNTFATLQDQEIIGISLSIPIVDWGLGKGRVQMATAQAERTRMQLQQELIDYRQNLYTQVMQFNNQHSQCTISKRAADIAEESYSIALRNFGLGNTSVTELNQLKKNRDDAMNNYIDNVGKFWIYYFGIRKATLYDYINNVDITTEFDKLLK